MRLVRYCICLALAGIGIGCAEDPSKITAIDNNFHGNYAVSYIDSASIETSTVLLDSFPTSGTGSLLLGNYADNKLGVVESKAFFQVIPGNAWSPSDKATFDSLVLVSTYSGYYHGDTTKTQTIEVREVLEGFIGYNLPKFFIDEHYYSILYANNSLFNNSSFKFDEAFSIGQKSMKAKPHSKDSLTLRMDNSLGASWLQLAIDNPTVFTKKYDQNGQLLFFNYFKGVVIKSGSLDPAWIVGLTTKNIKVKLYYTDMVNEVKVPKRYDFTIQEAFSNIAGDRSSTGLKDLTNTSTEVHASLTGEETYVEAGVGIVTKVTFPHIKQLLNLPGLLKVNDAQLLIEPVKGSYDKVNPLPPQLILLQTDNSNLPLGFIGVDYGDPRTPQTATISVNEEYGTNSGYAFSLTQYVQNLLTTQGTAANKALLISISQDELNKTVNRVCLGSGKNNDYRMKLRIYYTRTKY